MANITILDIKPAGVDLFADSESYLIDLSENELAVYGGIVWSYWIAQGAAAAVRSSQPCVGVAAAVTREIID
ncbi:hypothetical protein BJP36_14120 [Moorena producens JHB]|uniref:Uncharacterized protein n=1 Tax=Moorena producens (strain JHB) TaxID=1454205 RepID=A0A1D9FZS8_MOOP1|nr:hypothetical protein [Moorena producens]AOY80879.1 hypothetical protein BJP36_14120 [Moorena producens JHB]